MGRLALIADTLGESVIATAVRSNMKAALAPWLAGTNPDPLKYDPIWGGICSSAGLANGGADFGNGQYNECALSDFHSVTSAKNVMVRSKENVGHTEIVNDDMQT